jgi:hypothetical protein
MDQIEPNKDGKVPCPKCKATGKETIEVRIAAKQPPLDGPFKAGPVGNGRGVQTTLGPIEPEVRKTVTRACTLCNGAKYLRQVPPLKV